MSEVWWRRIVIWLPTIGFSLLSTAGLASAASMGPPMLDITHQCNASSHHSTSAMSECVVAESEARAEILQKWSRISDGSAQKCVKAGRKAARFPYAAMAKCLSTEPIAPAPVDETKK